MLLVSSGQLPLLATQPVYYVPIAFRGCTSPVREVLELNTSGHGRSRQELEVERRLLMVTAKRLPFVRTQSTWCRHSFGQRDTDTFG